MGKPYVATERTASGRPLAVAVRQTIDGETVTHERIPVSYKTPQSLAQHIATRRRDEIERQRP